MGEKKRRAVIQIDRVSKRFGEEEVLHPVSYEFREGLIYGIVGNTSAVLCRPRKEGFL